MLHEYPAGQPSNDWPKTLLFLLYGFPTWQRSNGRVRRFFPIIVTEIEEALEEYGLRHDSVVLRVTGCGNGCRPWVAEVALIGKAPNTYNIMLGGGYYGQRLNKLYRSNVKDIVTFVVSGSHCSSSGLSRDKRTSTSVTS